MKLLEEIISLASSEAGSIATLLRKCLVLAHTLKNDRLKTWAENELNGYDNEKDEVPEYRKTGASAKGLFLGPWGSQIGNQPIPPGMLHEEHRHWAEFTILCQPIASYENVADAARLIIEWPANLTALYQGGFFPRQIRVEQGMAGNPDFVC